MSDWVRAGAQLLRPLYDVMRREVLQGRKINTDDSPVPCKSREPARRARAAVGVRGDGSMSIRCLTSRPTENRTGR
ncbi:transposase [bacterium]|nr:transposase [bacterium]